MFYLTWNQVQNKKKDFETFLARVRTACGYDVVACKIKHQNVLAASDRLWLARLVQ